MHVHDCTCEKNQIQKSSCRKISTKLVAWNSEITFSWQLYRASFRTFNKHIYLHGFNLAQTFRVSIHVMEGRFGCCAFTCHLCLQHGHFSGTHLRKWAEPLLHCNCSIKIKASGKRRKHLCAGWTKAAGKGASVLGGISIVSGVSLLGLCWTR